MTGEKGKDKQDESCNDFNFVSESINGVAALMVNCYCLFSNFDGGHPFMEF